MNLFKPPGIDTETCSYCNKAEQEADFPMYRASCRGCAIRSLAHSPQFHKSGPCGRLDPSDPYSKALGFIFGDGWREGHVLVKAQADRIRNARALL